MHCATVKSKADGWAKAYRCPKRTPGFVQFTIPQPRCCSEPEYLRTGLECSEPVGAHEIVTADSRMSSNCCYCSRFLSFVASLTNFQAQALCKK